MKDIHDQTYYELLEIDATATQEEILKAYNRARATYGHNSPALYSLFNKEEAQELLRLIDEAYAVLSNQFKRKQYDTAKPKAPAPVPAPSETDFAIPPATPYYDESEKSRTPSSSQAPTDFEERRTLQAPPEPKITDAEKTENAKGFGNTPFGSYDIDPIFEDEIRKSVDFSGPFLQRVRLYKNINLDQICETTKISRPYLIAIEANNFTSLPAPVFVRGFIVQISKILGLDPAKASTSFIKLLKEAQGK